MHGGGIGAEGAHTGTKGEKVLQNQHGRLVGHRPCQCLVLPTGDVIPVELRPGEGNADDGKEDELQSGFGRVVADAAGKEEHHANKAYHLTEILEFRCQQSDKDNQQGHIFVASRRLGKDVIRHTRTDGQLSEHGELGIRHQVACSEGIDEPCQKRGNHRHQHQASLHPRELWIQNPRTEQHAVRTQLLHEFHIHRFGHIHPRHIQRIDSIENQQSEKGRILLPGLSVGGPDA